MSQINQKRFNMAKDIELYRMYKYNPPGFRLLWMAEKGEFAAAVDCEANDDDGSELAIVPKDAWKNYKLVKGKVTQYHLNQSEMTKNKTLTRNGEQCVVVVR